METSERKEDKNWIKRAIKVLELGRRTRDDLADEQRRMKKLRRGTPAKSKEAYKLNKRHRRKMLKEKKKYISQNEFDDLIREIDKEIKQLEMKIAEEVEKDKESKEQQIQK